ncbi:MAG: bifunctional diaminohydroxyphosphoribosylaminopyrimidine deaminase/5-amino-6-(5-phosphoribosylamino)uracil reductase RibD [Vicinamibacteraceae bacterium]
MTIAGHGDASRDDAHMATALAIAGRGRGRTSPNPMVGAVIVDDAGVVVGTGFHERAGDAHAEVHALRAAGAKARGATLYCTLEPCSHTGRTGPCAVAVAEAGVRRVVAAMQDPYHEVAGRGFAYLRDHGVDVQVGVREVEARRLNEVFVTNVIARRPFVVAKIAMSLDGAVAAAPGARTAVSGAASQRHAQRVRAEVAAIGIGSGTLIADDPVLTARDVWRTRPLIRVVFDRRLRMSPQARLCGTLDRGPILVVTTRAAVAGEGERARALAGRGVTILARDDEALAPAVADLLGHGVTSLLLEGGPALHAAAWTAGIVDRVRCYVSPAALGQGAVPWAMPPSFGLMALGPTRAEPLGADVLIEADVHRTH